MKNNLYECLGNFAKHCSFHILVKFKMCIYVSTVLLLLSVFQVSTLVENNERIYDTRHGGFVQFKDRQGKIFLSGQH